MLRQFTSYSAPDYERFHEAVTQFQERIPELALGLKEIIGKERKDNKAFITAFEEFKSCAVLPLTPRSVPKQWKRC